MSASGLVQPAVLVGVASEVNSSTATLGSGATFTGTWEEVLDYAAVTVTAFANVDSAADGLKFDWSHDGTNADRTEQSSVVGGTGRAFNLTVRARYFRVRYVNGASAQTAFRLGTTFKGVGSGLITRPLADAVDDENFALLVKAALTGKKPDGSYVNAAFTADNELVVTTAQAVSTVKGFSHGYVATAAIATFAVRSTAYTEQSTNAQRSIVSTSASDDGSPTGTGAHKVKITYLDATGAGPFTETVTLNGTGAVNTVATNICFIEKMEVTEVGSNGANVGTINLKAATGGGGVTIWSIAIGDNKTFGAHHYVPTGVTSNITGASTAHNGTTVGSGGLFSIRCKQIGVTNGAEIPVSDFIRLYGQSSTNTRTYDSPIQVAGPARCQMYVTTESSSSLTYRGSFDYYDS